MLTLRICTAVALVSLGVTAQLSDLQPGANFPTTAPMFGVDHTEAIASGDIDNDGDLDLIFANGGATGNQRNRIFVNQGGLQGGIEGEFIDESEQRIAGEPVDRSRDVAFVDIDSDGDLDVCIANSSPSAIFGEISRFYVNQGGTQGGTLGYFVDDTLARWGTLVSVPVDQQLFGDGEGPFADWTCDCDFADLDDDGDLDLFNAGYGPNLMGTEPSRIFLNDGAGVFHELWPWADDDADIELHTLDVDAFDIDGDFDLDLFAASRDSQARIYVNNLRNPIGPRPFHDVTQAALIDTGSTIIGDNNYEVEWMDMDSDGDFDVWMLNYENIAEVVLRNDSSAPGVIAFERVDWIRGGTVTQETESDFLDFDGDGDLDVVQSNFLGANPIFQSGLAQGLDPETDGLFHRTGTSSGGSLAPWPEVIESGPGGTSWDVHVGDLDGDGDHDVVIGNQNEVNRLLLNERGIPDTHAPNIKRVTRVQGIHASTARHVVHAQIEDNGPWYDVDRSDVTLVYEIVGKSPVRVPMFGQGGQLFRAEIPPVDGVVLYRVEAEDRDGNLATGVTTGFMQTASDAWAFVDYALTGALGKPLLGGSGTLATGSPNHVVFANIAPSAPFVLFVTPGALLPTPFKGGTLATIPSVFQTTLSAGADGTFVIPFLAPSNPMGVVFHIQAAILDPAAVQGVALTNVLTMLTSP